MAQIDLEQICEERMINWTAELAAAGGIPCILIGVSPAPDDYGIRIVNQAGLDPSIVAALLHAAAEQIERELMGTIH